MVGLREHELFATTTRVFLAHVIGHAPEGDPNQPAAWVVGEPLLGPLGGGGDERFLDGVFGGAEITEPPNDRAENLRRQLAQQILSLGIQRARVYIRSSGGALITWRTSIAMFIVVPPEPGADEARAAISYARSGRSTSTIQ